jgi:hypothetical protein
MARINISDPSPRPVLIPKHLVYLGEEVTHLPCDAGCLFPLFLNNYRQ